MKINEGQATHTSVKIATNGGPEGPAKKQSAAQSGDKVSLSPRARELIKAQQALATLPDIREDKVAVVKARIDEGRYHIDSEGIAAKMIQEGLSQKD